MPSRRTVVTSAAAAGGAMLMPFLARAEGGDRYRATLGDIVVHPISHASFVMEVPGAVIYNDPVGDPAMYSGHPPPGIITLTHEHADHFSAETLTALAVDGTVLVTNPNVFAMLPEPLKAHATALANGDSFHAGDIEITAIPAYNTTEDRKQYHPQGRDNGYVITVDGKRVYIAGDTEDIPEMRALTDVYIAFVPMNLPYTMDIHQAASAVNQFKPQYVYPYHYKGADLDAFAAEVKGPVVKRGPWYPAA